MGENTPDPSVPSERGGASPRAPRSIVELRELSPELFCFAREIETRVGHEVRRPRSGDIWRAIPNGAVVTIIDKRKPFYGAEFHGTLDRNLYWSECAAEPIGPQAFKAYIHDESLPIDVSAIRPGIILDQGLTNRGSAHSPSGLCRLGNSRTVFIGVQMM